MYYIYYIKRTGKVGCTSNLKKRVEIEQGYKNYKILYTTNDINKATEKEIYFQKKYNYKLDTIPYNKLNKQMNTYITKETVTFNNVYNKEDFDKYYNELKELDLLDLGIVTISEKTKLWIKQNLKKSIKNKANYIYTQSLYNFIEANKEKTIFDDIRIWAKEKGILDKGDTKTQLIKLQEEVGELSKSILNNNNDEFIDAIGDCVVVLTNLAKLKNYNIEYCIEKAYNEIKNRKGKMINNTFVKNK